VGMSAKLRQNVVTANLSATITTLPRHEPTPESVSTILTNRDMPIRWRSRAFPGGRFCPKIAAECGSWKRSTGPVPASDTSWLRTCHAEPWAWHPAVQVAAGFVVIQVVSGSILKRRSHWRPRAVASGTRRQGKKRIWSLGVRRDAGAERQLPPHI